MTEHYLDTVLLVCDDPAYAHSLLGKLFAAGVNVVGPAPTAAMALAMTAQTAPTIALVARPPAGRRGAHELAHDLLRLWGVRSRVLDTALGREDRYAGEPEPWALRAGEAERLDRALARWDRPQPDHG